MITNDARSFIEKLDVKICTVKYSHSEGYSEYPHADYYIDLETENVIRISNSGLFDSDNWIKELIEEQGCKRPRWTLETILKSSDKPEINGVELDNKKEYLLNVDEANHSTFSVYEIISVVEHLDCDCHTDNRIKYIVRDIETKKITIVIKEMILRQGLPDYLLYEQKINSFLKIDYLINEKKLALINIENEVVGLVNPELSIADINQLVKYLEDRELMILSKRDYRANQMINKTENTPYLSK